MINNARNGHQHQPGEVALTPVINESRLDFRPGGLAAYGQSAGVTGEMAGVHEFRFVLSGSCDGLFPDGMRRISAGTMIALNPGETVSIRADEACEMFVILMPESLLAEVCQEHGWPSPKERIRFTRQMYRTSDLGNLWSLLDFVRSEMAADDCAPRLLKHFACLVAGKLLASLEHDLNAPPPRHVVSFERLVRYIDEHIKQDISVEELANLAHMSARSLYLLFEKNAQTTPKNFIRRRKLEKVFSTLVNPASNLANVTAVALEYGFNHLGRFSECYKATFGVLPSESLKMRDMAGLAI